MSKSSRLLKQQQDRERFERTKIGEAARLKSISPVPHEVALNFSMADSDDGEPVTVSFSEFDLGKSKMDGMTQLKLKALFKKFKDVTSSTDNGNGLVRDTIKPVGKYEFLFRGLNSDLNMVEVEFAGGGRVFCHRVRNYLSVIAIRDTHINIDR